MVTTAMSGATITLPLPLAWSWGTGGLVSAWASVGASASMAAVPSAASHDFIVLSPWVVSAWRGPLPAKASALRLVACR